nr:immunoglobulin heavy chain junction region [Macaca mulatta]
CAKGSYGGTYYYFFFDYW